MYLYAIVDFDTKNKDIFKMAYQLTIQITPIPFSMIQSQHSNLPKLG